MIDKRDETKESLSRLYRDRRVIKASAGTFKILANKTTLEIVNALLNAPNGLSVKELEEVVSNVSQGGVSNLLRGLKTHQIVDYNPAGSSHIYRITPAFRETFGTLPSDVQGISSITTVMERMAAFVATNVPSAGNER